MSLYTVKFFSNRDVLQAEGPCTSCVTWDDRLYKAARACGVGRQWLGDPRVFGCRDWGATRGRNLVARRKGSVVRERGRLKMGWRRRVKTMKGKGYVWRARRAHGGRHVVEQYSFFQAIARASRENTLSINRCFLDNMYFVELRYF